MDKPLLCFGIVLYRELFGATKAYVSLLESFRSSGLHFDVYLYDNTEGETGPVPEVMMHPEFTMYYHLDVTNGGISKAYNYMARKAQANGMQWMVFLDQDTQLPKEAVEKYVQAIRQQPHVLLKAPVIRVASTILSPFKMVFKRSRSVAQVSAGVYSLKTFTVINSGLMVQLALFFKAGGYDEAVRLDFADFLFQDRVRKLHPTIEMLDTEFLHDFSHNETDKARVLKRYSIFITDLRNCPKPTWKSKAGYFVVGLLHTLKLSYRFRTPRFFSIWIHPQSA